MAVVAVGCGARATETSPSAVYAKEVERLVIEMNSTLVAIYAEPVPELTLEIEQDRWDEALEARNRFLDRATQLEPPSEWASLHDGSMAIVTELRDATAEIAEEARSAETLSDFTSDLRGPGGARFRLADARSIQLCLDAQEIFDTGLQQAAAFTTPWVQTARSETAAIDLQCYTPE